MSKYHENLTQKEIELMEKLADIEHQRWADWQKYMHSRMVELVAGNKKKGMAINGEDYSHWTKQIETDYKDLLEDEKESDREQVMRYWNLIK